MVSIYKVSKEDVNAIFAVDFAASPVLYFFENSEWVKDDDNITNDSIAEIYGGNVTLDDLKTLDGDITCLTKMEELSENVEEFLNTYAEIIKIQKDF
ncbi:hypothetical protein [Methanobrevibacter woesei]|uniref:hypothetical protein n=1 Tax=Methanobrevibacter woesei TaxID=190976 RepID=UPI0026DF975A|nr:hypothetical protein [Methanobrevibacter woesei]